MRMCDKFSRAAVSVIGYVIQKNVIFSQITFSTGELVQRDVNREFQMHRRLRRLCETYCGNVYRGSKHPQPISTLWLLSKQKFRRGTCFHDAVFSNFDQGVWSAFVCSFVHPSFHDGEHGFWSLMGNMRCTLISTNHTVKKNRNKVFFSRWWKDKGSSSLFPLHRTLWLNCPS